MRSMRTRLALAGIVLALAFTAPVAALEDGIPSPGAAPAARQDSVAATRGPAWPESATNGRAAVEALGTRLPDVARRHGWTAERLTATLLADPTLHVDKTDRLFYVETDVTTSAALPETPKGGPTALGAAPYPLTETFALHSLPGANLTILLDFGPRTMSGNSWTASKNGGSDIVCPAWSLDGDPAFSDAEKTAIQEIWQRVAEDYAPFKVDVTTQFTTEAAITRSGSSDAIYGTRVVVSPISGYFGQYGGIAYISAYNDVGDYYKPALVFPEWLGNNPKSIAEAASHEAGHNLGLNHDGTSTQGYYSGSGSGVTGWAPIMGSGYGKNLSQWSSGEYSDANNQEDDLAIISGFLGYRVDDVGGTAAAATLLPEATTLTASGLVASSSDVDVFRFSAGTGGAVVDVTPAPVGPDLDVSAEIRDSAGALIVASNPADALTSHLVATLSNGTYYLHVRGTGKGSPLTIGGYSSYASIGRYTVSGTVVAPAPDLPVGALSGTVIASGGGALSGVTVSMPGKAAVTTAGDGTYTMVGVAPGTYSATYSKAGYVSQTLGVTIVSATTTTRDVTLAPVPVVVPGTLAGTVSASGGAPLSGVSISIPGTASVTSDADGAYTVAGVTPGTYTATYSKTGFTSQAVAVTIAADATTTRDIVLVPAPAETLTPVYRFFNRANGSHFYTASEAEKNDVVANLSAIYELDGAAYKVSSAFGTPLHRFYNKSNGSHFYTASEAEKNDVIANLSANYTYDGIAYRVSASPVAGSTPVFRFFNGSNASHFYTASPAEKDVVAANLSETYTLDGVAFHVVR